jgi:tetratricopeptide (TPR) repeat protein
MHWFRFVVMWVMLGLLPVMGQTADDVPAKNTNKIIKLEKKLADNPDDLDALFEYGQLKAKMGDYPKAAETFEHMLSLRMGLDRVKLDLALVYVRMGKYDKAVTLFDDVLALNPPDAVRKNIEKVRARALAANKRHHFSGNVSMGLHRDSNANSASSTGQVQFADLVLNLDPSSQSQSDTQFYAAFSLKHQYRMGRPVQGGQHIWETQASYYRTEQASLNNLNLALYSLRTGPKVQLEGIPATLSAGFNYSYVTLHGHEYLNTRGLDLTYEHRLTKDLQLTGQLLVEDRDFINAPGITVYDDRTGNANQARLSLNYAFSQDAFGSVGVTVRRENTRQGYFDNEQITLAGTYTHMLPHEFFVTGQGIYRMADFDEVDPFVSSSTFRNDREKSVLLTLGKKLPHNLVWTIGYQERHVDSSLLNFAFFNRRVSTGLSWRF